MSGHDTFARAHVIRCRQLVRDQRERTDRLNNAGKHEDISHDLLKTFEETLRLLEADLARIEGTQSSS
ncbi:MAG: hypothetical protein ACTHLO_05145 [Pseudolabrys sp.]